MELETKLEAQNEVLTPETPYLENETSTQTEPEGKRRLTGDDNEDKDGNEDNDADEDKDGDEDEEEGKADDKDEDVGKDKSVLKTCVTQLKR